MNSLTYLIIGYALGCIAGCIAMYWAMKIHNQQNQPEPWDIDHDATDWSCECYTCQSMRRQS